VDLKIISSYGLHLSGSGQVPVAGSCVMHFWVPEQARNSLTS